MDTSQLELLISKCLKDFYDRRIQTVAKLKLHEVLQRKNPYLFRALGTQKASEIVDRLASDYISSSDETIFADEFFEPICKAVSEAQTAAAKGVDFVIETDDAFEAISLKSGPNAFNSSQVAKQVSQFEETERSLRATLRSMRKAFIPIMGCGYGRVDSPPTATRRYSKIAGQAFWEHVTGDPDFYLKLVRLMKDEPAKHREAYQPAWDATINRFTLEFIKDFCFADGSIDWEKLVRFVSAKERPRHVKGSLVM